MLSPQQAAITKKKYSISSYLYQAVTCQQREHEEGQEGRTVWTLPFWEVDPSVTV